LVNEINIAKTISEIISRNPLNLAGIEFQKIHETQSSTQNLRSRSNLGGPIVARLIVPQVESDRRRGRKGELALLDVLVAMKEEESGKKVGAKAAAATSVVGDGVKDRRRE
jgi:hypothetical protein